MKLIFLLSAAFAALSTSVSSHAIPKASTINASTSYDVAVSLATTDRDGQVVATVKNVGTTDISVLRTGGLLDSLPTDKLDVVRENGEFAPFQGISLRVLVSLVGPEQFELIPVGASVNTTIDVASLYDVGQGGNFTVTAEGVFGVHTNSTATATAAAVYYRSNTLALAITPAAAAAAPNALGALGRVHNNPLPRPHPGGRGPHSQIVPGCSAQQQAVLAAALGDCAQLAGAGARAARDTASFVSGRRMVEYFGDDAAGTRDEVAGRLKAIEAECAGTAAAASRAGGRALLSCGDEHGVCAASPGVLAYALPALDRVYPCGVFFDDMAARPRACHGYDRASTLVHEMSHLGGVYAPGTLDIGYGYGRATSLPPKERRRNADNFSFFVNAIAVDC